MVKVASDADRETDPRRRPRRGLSGRRGLPRGASGDYLAATRDEPGSGRRPDGDAIYRTQILPGRRSSAAAGDPPRSASTSSTRSRPSGGRSPGRPASATTRRRIGRRSRTIRRTSPTREELLARANEDIERAMAVAPTLLRALPDGRLRGPAGRGVQGARRAVRLLLPAVDRRVPARASTTSTPTTCPREVLEARHDDVPRGGAGPSLPDRPRDGEPAPQRVPAVRLADRRSARTSRAGACTASASPTRWASTATRRSASGCSTPRPGARPGSSSTPAARPPLDAPAVDRLPARRRPVGDRRDDRDRPLHRLAGPGPHLQARPARDRAAPPRARGPRRRPLRPARVPRPGPRPRLAAAGDAGARAPELGGHAA